MSKNTAPIEKENNLGTSIVLFLVIIVLFLGAI